MHKKSLTNQIKTLWWSLKLLMARLRYGNPSRKMQVVGVTGTNGKTTTTTLLYKVATMLGYKAGLIGTVEILIDGKKYEFADGERVPATTPDSVNLTKILSKMKSAGCQYVFMEVSSHAIVQNRIRGVRFAGGVFTNLTHDHLDYHKNFKNYFLAKKKFFDDLSPLSWALTNADDEHGKRMLEDSEAQKFYYGFDYSKESNPDDPTNRDFFASITELSASGTKLQIDSHHAVRSSLIGRFNAYNTLCVFGVCSLLGFDTDKVAHALENIEPPRGRFQKYVGRDDIVGIVDYAHSPDAIQNVLSTLRQVLDGGRIISVFGCGGDRDPMKRSAMGKIGATMSDIAVFTSDNPRGEDPAKIIVDMQVDLDTDTQKKVMIIQDRHEAITAAAGLAQPGDVVIIMGKGHENYQEVAGVKHHFDDMEELQNAL